jgi:PAS domain S-box-containing protein
MNRAIAPDALRAAEEGAQVVEAARARRALLNILEDVQKERALADTARRQWIKTVDALSDPLLVHDAGYRVVRCNRAYAARAGMEIPAILGRPYWECFPRATGPAPACARATTERLAESSEEITLDTGEVFHLRCFAADAGESPTWLAVFEDITERKRAAEKLELSERRFRSLIEGSSDVIYLLDAEGSVRYRSPSASRLLGRDDARVIGSSVLRDLHPDDTRPARAAMAEVLREPGKPVRIETRLQRADGEWLTVEVVGVNRLDDAAVGGVILNLRDITERKAAEARIRRLLEATIGAMAAALESRDPYTAGHQRRVADLATAIARDMGLPEGRVQGVHFGALIHDLGKIQVPAELLSKPTRLTKLEFDLIKTHPQAGYDIVKGIDFPWPVAEMVLQHHERLDGSGYPQGLKGDQIALEARILAVADVVEAMASHRPYRPGLGIDKALKEIEDRRGAWYCAEAVDACLRLFREEGYSLG